MKYEQEKSEFLKELKSFCVKIPEMITKNGEWTIRGFIDIFRNIHTISTDTKIISKILELHLFPYIVPFAEKIGYEIELASKQNYYPDLTFIKKVNKCVKFAVDLKTTCRLESNPAFCNGFTLGSHGEYFINRDSGKNIQYPYEEYSGHFCLGIIYSRNNNDSDEKKLYTVDEVEDIPAVISNFTFFAEEKWKIASDKGGSGNTANIGSIKCIADIISGNGTFVKAGEEIFDDYWANFNKIEIMKNGKSHKMTSFEEYLLYRGLSAELNNR